MRGIIEGFYGTPWTWDQRREICEALHLAGMDTYVYAPKGDPLHRDRWRDPYDSATLAEFERLSAAATLRVGFSIGPGLSMDTADPADRAVLLEKIDQVVGTGISLVGLLLDDLDPAPGLGEAHGRLTSWLREHLDPSVELFMVPLHYTGVRTCDYLVELDRHVPAEVAIGWTGRYVVNESITESDAAAWSNVMGGRRPLLWDNTPVNDALMTDHLFTGPLRGREPGLVAAIHGYLANPMLQATACLPALLSAAAWLSGGDPDEAWSSSLGGHRVFMEGCDGVIPSRLTDAALADEPGALEELQAWFAEAESVDVSALGAEVEPWADQLRTEAAICSVAVTLLRSDVDDLRRAAPLLLVMWPARTGRSEQVLGGRGSLLPRLGQDSESRWIAAGSSYVGPSSVTARLVRAVFDRLASFDRLAGDDSEI